MIEEVIFIVDSYTKKALSVLLFVLTFAIVGVTGNSTAYASEKEQNTSNKEVYISEEAHEEFSELFVEEELVINIEEGIDPIEFKTRKLETTPAKEEKQKENKNVNVYLPRTHISKVNLYRPTNLSLEQWELLLKDTELKGFGYAFVEIEKEFGINGLFALGVANLESGLGKSRLARVNNNLYGMKGSNNGLSRGGYQLFKSKADSVKGFAKLIRKRYWGMDVNKISRIYCPPNSVNWVRMLNGGYQRFVNILTQN